MKDYIEKRVKKHAKQCIDTHDTVRGIAKRNLISKSTVHRDLAERLQEIDLDLYEDVGRILQENKAERHIRGGESTRRKYLAKKSQLY